MKNYLSEQEARRAILDVGKRIYDRGYVAANDGNISCKISDTTIQMCIRDSLRSHHSAAIPFPLIKSFPGIWPCPRNIFQCMSPIFWGFFLDCRVS